MTLKGNCSNLEYPKFYICKVQRKATSCAEMKECEINRRFLRQETRDSILRYIVLVLYMVLRCAMSRCIRMYIWYRTKCLYAYIARTACSKTGFVKPCDTTAPEANSFILNDVKEASSDYPYL